MQKAIVLHSDILGFKELVKISINDKGDKLLFKLKETINQSVETIQMLKKNNSYTYCELNHKLFSDNLYVSFSYNESNHTSLCYAFILCIIFSRLYFENMINNKFFIRGGISFGNDYSDENIIFSHALVKAYELESQKAIYPRILIDNDLLNLLQDKFEVPSSMMLDILNNSITIDENGLYFINPTGIAADFNQEYKGLKGVDLDKKYITQNINFIEVEIQKIDKDIARVLKTRKLCFGLMKSNQLLKQKKRVKIKYEWLKSILLWNFNNQKGTSNRFKRVIFKIS
jgi:hypothetical protein